MLCLPIDWFLVVVFVNRPYSSNPFNLLFPLLLLTFFNTNVACVVVDLYLEYSSSTTQWESCPFCFRLDLLQYTFNSISSIIYFLYYTGKHAPTDTSCRHLTCRHRWSTAVPHLHHTWWNYIVQFYFGRHTWSSQLLYPCQPSSNVVLSRLLGGHFVLTFFDHSISLINFLSFTTRLFFFFAWPYLSPRPLSTHYLIYSSPPHHILISTSTSPIQLILTNST